MKEYPSMSRFIVRDRDIYAFDKLDGSQIRAEWHSKHGFHKFGTRKRRLDVTHWLGEAIELIKEKYGKNMAKVFKECKWGRAECFFEFFGPNSFAGTHQKEEHDVVLFDVKPFKSVILLPQEFIKYFGHLDIPKMVYYGKANRDFEREVREGILEGVTFEGVVCKGAPLKKGFHPLMFKIKTNAWVETLGSFTAGDLKLFNELL